MKLEILFHQHHFAMFVCRVGLVLCVLVLLQLRIQAGCQQPRRFLMTCKHKVIISLQGPSSNKDTVAEWLRRQIRNLLEFLRAGSSPVGVVLLLRALARYSFATNYCCARSNSTNTTKYGIQISIQGKCSILSSLFWTMSCNFD